MPKVYWTDAKKPSIKRADLDGSNVETVADFEAVPYRLMYPTGLEIDGSTIFWSSVRTKGSGVLSTPINNAAATSFLFDGPGLSTRSLALTNNAVFVADGFHGRILRIDRTTNEQTVFFETDGPRSMCGLDHDSGKLYLRDSFFERLLEIDAIDARSTTLLSKMTDETLWSDKTRFSYGQDVNPFGLLRRGDVTVLGSDVYWSDFGMLKLSKIGKDGTGHTHVFSNDRYPDEQTEVKFSGLANDGTHIFAVEYESQSIARIDTDGTGLRTIVPSEKAGQPVGLAIA